MHGCDCLAGSRLWVYAVILLALLVGGVYGYTWYSNNDSNNPLSGTSSTNTQTTSQSLKGHVESITKPPSEFSGPTYTREIPELKIIVTLSNSSVKIGETLWMKISLIGENAYSVKKLRINIMNSEGQKVYDTYVWLHHRTLTPGNETPHEETYNIAWKATNHPSANIDITPGNYTIIIKTNINGEEVTVKGIVEVVE